MPSYRISYLEVKLMKLPMYESIEDEDEDEDDDGGCGGGDDDEDEAFMLDSFDIFELRESNLQSV